MLVELMNMPEKIMSGMMKDGATWDFGSRFNAQHQTVNQPRPLPPNTCPRFRGLGLRVGGVAVRFVLGGDEEYGLFLWGLRFGVSSVGIGG